MYAYAYGARKRKIGTFAIAQSVFMSLREPERTRCLLLLALEAFEANDTAMGVLALTALGSAGLAIINEQLRYMKAVADMRAGPVRLPCVA